MLGLISHISPRIIYLTEEEFEASTAVLEAVESDCASEFPDEVAESINAVLAEPRVKAFVKKWGARDGELCRVAANVMCDAILHLLIVSTPWLDEFESEIENLIDDIKFELSTRSNAQKLAQREDARKKAHQLAADPRFNGPKISRSKRIYLAQSIFTDAERSLIASIVEEAENLTWLRANSVSEA